MEPQRLLKLQRWMDEVRFFYLKAGASFCSYQLIRTCVIDSYLAAFHITAKIFPNVEDLFNSDELFRRLMALLSQKKYSEAKFDCVNQLKHVQFDHTTKKIDFYGSVYDHFYLFYKLVCVNNGPIHEVLSQFQPFNYIMALGDPGNPTLILGGSLITAPMLHVEDKKKRIFQLQFLLLGKEEHMTMCFRFSRNNWKLYDNNQAKPSFQYFFLDELKDYEIHLAGYVNITQAQEYKLGTAETGEAAGAKPFCMGTSSSLLDPELSTYPVAIPETAEGLGPRPFSPIFDDMDQLVEDVEMLSFDSV